MNNSRVSYRYAKSLLDLSREQDRLEPVYSDMKRISATVAESRELQLFLKSPVVKSDKKEAALKALFGSCDKMTLLFIDILLRRKREGILGQVALGFETLYKQQKGIRTAFVTSAVPLSDSVRNKVKDLVMRAHKGEVEVIEKVDSNLIGGLVLRMGDTQVDASIARRFRELKQEFSKNPYIPEF
jgi:F-type H+-transporting ATPase subunit delta